MARTKNTRTLDDKFDPSWEHFIESTLGKHECEVLGSALLNQAKKYGHYVAMHPQQLVTIVNRGHREFTLSDVDFMASVGLLVKERTPDGVVVSPSYRMAFQMYRRDRTGKVYDRTLER